MREFDPEHEALRAEMASGAIGRPMLVGCTHANLGAGVPIVDAFIRSAVHDLHTLRFLTDQEIREVMVHTIPADEGAGLIRLATHHLPTGLSARRRPLNMAAGYGYDVQVEVTGESGVVRTEALVSSTDGSEARSIPTHWLDRFQTAYRTGDRSVGRLALDTWGSRTVVLGWLRHGRCGQRLYRVGQGRPASFGRTRPAPDRELVGWRLSRLLPAEGVYEDHARLAPLLQTYRRCRLSQRPSLDCRHAGLYAAHGRSTAPPTQPPEVGSGFGMQQPAVGGCFV